VTGIQIDVADLWTGKYDDRHPLADLDTRTNSHIHARLTIVIDGRDLPRLGYWGPDDVCLNTWVPELLQIRSRLQTDEGRHVFDEGEQGQPAYAFERSRATVFVSLLPSELGDGLGHPEWLKVACPADELLGAIDRVLDRIREQVLGIGAAGERWWRRLADDAQRRLTAPQVV
jgi:hypothetical protein